MTIIKKWLTTGSDVQRISRSSLLIGFALVLGPSMSVFVRTWQHMSALPPGFESLPSYNPSVFASHYPAATVVVSGMLGCALVVIALGFARGLPWARTWLTRACLVGMVLWVIQGALWAASALPQTRPSLRFMGIGSLVLTPIGAIVLLRVVRRLKCIGLEQ